jgi:hypothetical protein
MLEQKLEKSIGSFPNVFYMESSEASPRAAVLAEKFTDKKGIWQTR